MPCTLVVVLLEPARENFEDDAVEAAKKAADLGVQVDVIGVGSTTGAPNPMDGGYLTDDEGNPETTYLNEKMAQQIADADDIDLDAEFGGIAGSINGIVLKVLTIGDDNHRLL